MKNLKLSFILGVALCAGLTIIHSCKKDLYTAEPAIQKIESLRQDFEAKKFPENLLGSVQQIKGDQIIWEIQWDAKSLKTESKDNGLYTYIPMKPRLLSGKTRVSTFGYHRFLLIVQKDNKNYFYVAYTFDDEQSPSSKLTDNGFTGVLQLKDLEGLGILKYRFGRGVIKAGIEKDKRLMSLNKTMMDEDCFYTYLCSYNYWCSSSSEMYVTATTGSSCSNPPTWNPCPGSSLDDVSWSSAGSEQIGRTCFPVSPPIDPPAPPGTGDPGGQSPDPTSPAGGVAEPTSFNFPMADPADLQKHFQCFNTISDIAATWIMNISVDLPVNDDPSKLVTLSTVPPSPGHVYITLTKFGDYDLLTGMKTVTKSFGFYPQPEILSLSTQGVGSRIVDDGGRERNAMKSVVLTKEQFDIVMQQAIYLAGHKSYDLNDYNCTDYAIEVWNNQVDDADKLSIADWIGPTTGFNYGRTPNGLYNMLAQKKAYGDQSISLSTDKAANKSLSCQ